MATGNVAIRFSVENQETVRQALQNLGKDGEKALQQLNTAAQTPHKGLSALSGLIDDLKSRATGLAFSIGPVGTGLVALGPAGLVAAAAIGGVVSAYSAAVDVTERFTDRIRLLKEATDTTGLAATQLRALAEAGSRVGIDFAKTATLLERMTVSAEGLRRGSGNLFEALLRIDAGLVRETAIAGTTAQVIDALARAYGRLDEQGKKNAFAKAIGGGEGIEIGRLFDEINKVGGLDALKNGLTGPNIDDAYVQRITAMRREVEEIRKRTDNLWGHALAPDVLSAQKQMELFWGRIAQHVIRVRDNLGHIPWSLGNLKSLTPPAPAEESKPTAPVTRSLGPLSFGGHPAAREAIPGPAAPKSPDDLAAVELGIARKWASAIGDAISPTEQFRQRMLELRVALKDNEISSDQYWRAVVAITQAHERAAVSTRTQIGIATEEEMLQVRLFDLQTQRKNGFIKDDAEMAAAERLMRKEVKETSEAMQVRGSFTPALTKLSIDAGKLKDSLDQDLSGALRGVTTDLIEMAKGTKTVSDGLSTMAIRFAEAIAQAMLMKTVVSPLANGLSGGLSGLFGGSAGGVDAGGGILPSALGNAFSRGHLTPFALGGVVHRPTFFPMANGAGLMGEAGPEAVMPLRRLSGGRLGVSSDGAGGQVTVQIINNHPAANISTREESDGRGGRRTVAIIEEMVASAFGRQQSPAFQQMQRAGALARR